MHKDYSQTSSLSLTIGKNAHTSDLVTMPLHDFARGFYILGSTGGGKTTFEVNLVLQAIQKRVAVCYMTPHADAIEDIVKRLPEGREQDILFLDLNAAYPFQLNLFQTDTTDELAISLTQQFIYELFNKLFYKEGDLVDAPMLFDSLTAISKLIFFNKVITFSDMPLLLENKEKTLRLVENIPDEYATVKYWWETLFTLKPAEVENKIGSLKRRLKYILDDMIAKRIFSCNRSSLDMRSLVESNKIILVKLDAMRPQLTSLIGATLVSLIAQAGYSRTDTPEELRKPFLFLADEFQYFATPTFSKILSEMRKYNICTVIAHQYRDQLDELNKGATLQAGSLAVFPCQGADAREMAEQFRVPDSLPAEQGVLSADIIPHLLREGHPSESVVAFIQTYLRAFQRARGEDIEEVRFSRAETKTYYPVQVFTLKNYAGELEYTYTPDAIRDGMVALSDFLYNCVRAKTYIGDTSIPPQVTQPFSGVLGFSNYLSAFLNNPTQELQAHFAKVAKLYQYRKELWKRQRDKNLPDEQRQAALTEEAAFNLKLHEAEKQYDREIAKWLTDLAKRQDRTLNLIQWWQTGVKYRGRLPSSDTDTLTLAWEIVQAEKKAYERFCASISSVISALIRNPIYSSNTKYGIANAATRTIADRQAELAKLLSHPTVKFGFYVKLADGREMALQGLLLPPASRSVSSVTQTIRGRNLKDGFIRTKERVQAEMDERERSLKPLPSLQTSISPQPAPPQPRPAQTSVNEVSRSGSIPGASDNDDELSGLPPQLPDRQPPPQTSVSPAVRAKKYTPVQQAFNQRYKLVNGGAEPAYLPVSESPEEKLRRRYREVNGVDMPEGFQPLGSAWNTQRPLSSPFPARQQNGTQQPQSAPQQQSNGKKPQGRKKSNQGN